MFMDGPDGWRRVLRAPSTLSSSSVGHVRGESPCLWYKFKRFESLSLLNLYHLQDQLVGLDQAIGRQSGEVSPKQTAQLRTLLNEYRQ